MTRSACGDEVVVTAGELQVRGAHNRVNLCGAISAVRERLGDDERTVRAARQALRTLEPLTDRLDVVARDGALAFAIDALATIPQATIEAVDAFGPDRVALIVGGQDRGVDHHDLVAALVARPHVVAVIGVPDTGHRVAAELVAAARDAGREAALEVTTASGLDEAVRAAVDALRGDGTVLLSPAAPSFNRYLDYRAMSEHFRTIVGELTGPGSRRAMTERTTHDPAPAFDPDRFATFDVTAWDATETDAGVDVALTYRLGEIEFVERLSIGVPATMRVRTIESREVRHALALTHLTAGLSYFKAAMPPAVRVRSALAAATVEGLMTALVDDGLAELRTVAELGDRARHVRVDVEPDRAVDDVDRRASHGGSTGLAVVPVGGGKDSLVALDIVARSGRRPIVLGIDTSGDPLGTLELERFHPVVRVRRTIDPTLLALNARGALNGHIPITAIVMSIAVTVAALVGADEVVMANERDASLPTRVVGGQPVNHQYSKSWDFERRFDAAVRAEVAGIDVFSLLRPVPEALIFGRMATMTDLLPRISSCNRVRTRGGGSDAGRRWCNACPKCAYSFLGLAAHLPPDVVVPIFGRNLLDAAELVDEYLGLLQLDGAVRPFECIGEPDDARWLARRCCEQPAWSDTVVCRAVADRVTAAVPPRIGGPNHVPDVYWPALRALEGER